MALAESIAAISAILQAADMYAKYGSSSGSSLTTLHLESPTPPIQPRAAAIAFSLPSEYEELFKAVEESALDCARSFTQAIKSKDLLPEERQRLGMQLRKCVCREIRILRDAMQTQFPQSLTDLWDVHRCDVQ